MPSPFASRLIAAPVLLGTGFMALPAAATFLDTQPGLENWILPAQVAATAVVGAGVGAAMPAIAGAAATRGKGAAVGAAAGIGAAVLADVAWAVLIGG